MRTIGIMSWYLKGSIKRLKGLPLVYSIKIIRNKYFIVPGMHSHAGYIFTERYFTRYLELISVIFASIAAKPSSILISPTTTLFR